MYHNRLRQCFLQAIVIAVAMILLLAAFEGIARFLIPDDTVARRGLDLQHFSADRAAVPDLVLGYRLKKQTEVANFHYNSLGFVGKDFVVPKPAGVFRIFCLGGSTTLGAGAAADRFSYPALLEEIFRRTSHNPGQRVEVVNAGVFGYHSWHTLLRVQKELPAYQPDYYVIMDGLNDVMAACQQMTPQDLKRMSSSMQSVLLKLVAPEAPGWLAGLRHRLDGLALYELAGEIGEKLRGLWARPAALDYANRLELFGFRRNLTRVVQRAQQGGIGVLLVNHPWVLAAVPRVAEAMNIAGQDVGLYVFGRHIVAATDAAVAQERSVRVADPQPVFDRIVETTGKPRLVFSDTFHFTRYGNYQLAKTVYRALMADPAVRQVTGLDAPVSDAALDALFPDILAWRPTDGSGWPRKEEQVIATKVLAMTGMTVSAPDGEGTVTANPEGERAMLRLRLLGPIPKQVFFYPRISGDGKSVVRVAKVEAGSGRQTLFTLDNTTHDGLWSPVAGRYTLALPPQSNLELEITLEGHDAQLWGCNQGWFFGAASP